MRLQHISLIAGISALYGIVGYTNYQLTPTSRYYDLTSSLDLMIPFQLTFAWPYLFYYVLLGVPLFIRLPRAQMLRLWKNLAWASAVSAVLFLLIPTFPPRPDDIQNLNGLSAWIIKWIYLIDPPSNCFPSLHVLHSFLLAISYYQFAKTRKWGILFLLMATGVAFATVFIKQHYILDVVAAMLLLPFILRLAHLPLGRSNSRVIESS